MRRRITLAASYQLTKKAHQDLVLKSRFKKIPRRQTVKLDLDMEQALSMGYIHIDNKGKIHRSCPSSYLLRELQPSLTGTGATNLSSPVLETDHILTKNEAKIIILEQMIKFDNIIPFSDNDRKNCIDERLCPIELCNEWKFDKEKISQKIVIIGSITIAIATFVAITRIAIAIARGSGLTLEIKVIVPLITLIILIICGRRISRQE
jgi:hypothetical protein